MKKRTLVLTVFVLLTTTIFAQLSGYIEAGTERFQHLTDHNGELQSVDWYLFTTLGIKWIVGPLTFEGNNKTDMFPRQDSYTFMPFHNRYTVNITWSITNWIHLSATHMCGHQVVVGDNQGGFAMELYDEMQETISIRVEF
jgi:hypothetical protein